MCGAVGTLICRSGYDALLLSHYGRRGTVFLDDGAPATWFGGGGSVGRAGGREVLIDDSSPFARKFVGSVESRYLVRGRDAAGRSRWIGGSVGRRYSIQVM